MAGINLEHLMKGLYPGAVVEPAGKDTVKVALFEGGKVSTIKMTQAGGKTTLNAAGEGTRVLTKAEVNAAVKKGAEA